MIIANFTPDDIPWTHVGVTGIIKSQEIVEVEEGRGNFILTKNGRRGLVQMQYGDDEEKKKEQSMELWKTFWEQQITVQNQANEEQKEKGQRYAKPSKELQVHADMLGLELLRPWTVKTPQAKDNQAVDELKKENQELKTAINAIQSQMSQLVSLFSEGKKQETEITSNRKKYRILNENTMKGWLRNNWGDIQDMPEENRFEIQSLYEDLYKEKFPSQKP